MKYDVVIRCRNEIEWLPKVIKSLKTQSINPEKIILVDNNSDDGSIEYAIKENCIIVKYDKPEFNYSYSLNLGINETSQPNILILSAHCEIVTQTSIQNMIEVREYYDAAGVFGRQIPTIKSSPIDTRDLITVFGRERIVYKKYPFFHNAFSLIDRKAWEICHFDESQNGVEDRFWAREQALKGRKIVYEPDSIAFHEHGLNQTLSNDRAIRVCKSLKVLHEDDIFTWPSFK